VVNGVAKMAGAAASGWHLLTARFRRT